MEKMNTDDVIFTSAEDIIANDIGNRGIEALRVKGDLRNCLRDLNEAHRIALTTGFFVPSAAFPETDGPLGCIAIAQALVGLGKEVTLLCDTKCVDVMRAGLEHRGLSSVDIVLFPEVFPEVLEVGPIEMDAQSIAMADACGLASLSTLESVIDVNRFDHLLSIERLGGAADGHVYNMRAKKMDEHTARIDAVFQLVSLKRQRGMRVPKTTGIGDGGNEIGMGKVYSRIAEAVTNGSTLGTIVSTNHLITCGISNWGGYAIASLLYYTNGRPSPNLVPTVEEEKSLLQCILDVGCVDGCTGQRELSVDSFPFEQYVEALSELRKIVGL